jgi:hypothetical protein
MVTNTIVASLTADGLLHSPGTAPDYDRRPGIRSRIPRAIGTSIRSAGTGRCRRPRARPGFAAIVQRETVILIALARARIPG